MTADSPAPADSPTADWYFDFISPFAYLQHELLLRRAPALRRNYRAVLFAALLKHWDSKGPAEIPAKRVATYRHCQWLGKRHDIELRFPPAHPFNSLPALRLAVALDCAQSVVTAIFRAIYVDGADFSRRADWEAVRARLGVADGDDVVAAQAVKDALRANTERAIAAGVFGVPTLIVAEQMFWGLDMTEMALECAHDPTRFERGAYRRLTELPVGVVRKV
ncbi:MAG: 2-hydroxychromene-2-carboxylate isomerase [bacterium]